MTHQGMRKIFGIFAVAVFIIGAVAIIVFSDGGKDTQVLNQDQYNLEQTVGSAEVPKNLIPPATTSTTANPKSTTNTTAKPSTTGPVAYTRAQVATHSSASSCWTIVNGGVYDLTKWIDGHPGGSKAILSICGEDGSEDFNEQHGGDGGPEKILASYKIGVLK